MIGKTCSTLAIGRQGRANTIRRLHLEFLRLEQPGQRPHDIATLEPTGAVTDP